MKTRFAIPCLVLALAPLVQPAAAGGPSTPAAPPAAPDTVTFLGVETRPVDEALAAHMGLTAGFGLTVTDVVPGSPAAGCLQRNDILLKLGDQRLASQEQLSALVREKQPGDEVALTLLRAGKTVEAGVKLGSRERPAAESSRPGLGQHRGMRDIFEDFPNWEEDGWPFGIDEHMRELVDRMRGFNRGIPSREDADTRTTVFQSDNSRLAYSDSNGSLEITVSDGHRSLVAKDKDGKVVFEGPVDTPEQRKALPPSVSERLQLVESLNPSCKPAAPGAEKPPADSRACPKAATPGPRPQSTTAPAARDTMKL